ncbi:unnamed protein product [Caenorhabditis angaria]|uniref:Uncharacterized protein n=1 Tax=Caenorhabditis angaria TaxID=860376 RepID=A0A9P1NC45_9PELO|nr:unnamed protein product [Caenorhabditis angaria]
MIDFRLEQSKNHYQHRDGRNIRRHFAEAISSDWRQANRLGKQEMISSNATQDIQSTTSCRGAKNDNYYYNFCI